MHHCNCFFFSSSGEIFGNIIRTAGLHCTALARAFSPFSSIEQSAKSRTVSDRLAESISAKQFAATLEICALRRFRVCKALLRLLNRDVAMMSAPTPTIPLDDKSRELRVQ